MKKQCSVVSLPIISLLLKKKTPSERSKRGYFADYQWLVLFLIIFLNPLKKQKHERY